MSAAPSPPEKPTIVVVGAGLVGVTTSYYLAAKSTSHEILCIDAGSEPASGTSRANAGRFCPTLLHDFAPSLGVINPYNLWMKDKSKTFSSMTWSSKVVKWGVGTLYAATYNRSRINACMTELAVLAFDRTRQLLDELAADEKLEYRAKNIWVFANEKGQEKGIQRLNKIPALEKDAATRAVSGPECAGIVPELATYLHQLPTAGCVVANRDFTLDCYKFTKELASLTSSRYGVKFRFGVRASRIEMEGTRVVGVRTASGELLPAEHVILACGPQTSDLVEESCGKKLAILPVRGCSVDLSGVTNGPSVALSDESSGDTHLQITPFDGARARLAGFAQVVDSSTIVECPVHLRDELVASARALLPGMQWSSESKPWCGLRPVTPDNLPLVGRSDQLPKGLWIHAGHGYMGWTLSAATSEILADQVLGIRQTAATESLTGALAADRFRWLGFL